LADLLVDGRAGIQGRRSNRGSRVEDGGRIQRGTFGRQPGLEARVKCGVSLAGLVQESGALVRSFGDGGVE
jgi:hypothetical protein